MAASTMSRQVFMSMWQVFNPPTALTHVIPLSIIVLPICHTAVLPERCRQVLSQVDLQAGMCESVHRCAVSSCSVQTLLAFRLRV